MGAILLRESNKYFSNCFNNRKSFPISNEVAIDMKSDRVSSRLEKSANTFNDEIFLDIQRLIDQSENDPSCKIGNKNELKNKIANSKKFQEVIQRIYERESKIKDKLSNLRILKYLSEVKEVQQKPTISK